MPTSHAINIAALLDAAERWPDAGGDTRVTELRVRVSYRVLTF